MKITPEQEILVREQFEDQNEADRFLNVMKLLCPKCGDDEGGLLKDGKCQMCGYIEVPF